MKDVGAGHAVGRRYGRVHAGRGGGVRVLLLLLLRGGRLHHATPQLVQVARVEGHVLLLVPAQRGVVPVQTPPVHLVQPLLQNALMMQISRYGRGRRRVDLGRGRGRGARGVEGLGERVVVVAVGVGRLLRRRRRLLGGTVAMVTVLMSVVMRVMVVVVMETRCVVT